MWVLCIFVVVFVNVCGWVLSVLLSKLNSDVVAANGEAAIFTLKGAGRISRVEELDEGEALNSAKVGAAPISVLGDVDVADGAILLKDGAKLLYTDIAGQVTGNDGFDANRESGQLYKWDISYKLLDNRPGGERNTTTVRADRHEVGLRLSSTN